MTERGAVSVCALFGIWLLSLSLQGQQGVEKQRSPHAEPPGAAPSHLCEESLLPC